ncbi:MAG: 4Fe-4S dicluster domain-containing protein [candidate division Zixibacteria bacterium]|nr:4Fe-4S dicluster domain-containing protein [candidate division Zixibacteria bacterium]
MNKDRRKFLKMATATVAAATILPSVSEASLEHCEEDFDNAFGVLVDTTVCIGCRNCELACDRQNELTDHPKSYFMDNTVFDSRRRPSVESYTVVNSSFDSSSTDNKSFGKIQCMHCNHPACVSACIVGALTKCKHGVVSYDAWKCIGCRYCMVACPFQIPAYEYKEALKPRVMKCTFCYDLIHNDKKPACVESCPVEALTFGKRGDLIKHAHVKIEAAPNNYYDHVFGENEIGGTSWMYLANKDFINYDLPKLEEEKIPSLTESIQHGIFKSFLPPLALYGFLGLVMHSIRQDKKKEEENDEQS